MKPKAQKESRAMILISESLQLTQAGSAVSENALSIGYHTLWNEAKFLERVPSQHQHGPQWIRKFQRHGLLGWTTTTKRDTARQGPLGPLRESSLLNRDDRNAANIACEYSFLFSPLVAWDVWRERRPRLPPDNIYLFIYVFIYFNQLIENSMAGLYT